MTMPWKRVKSHSDWKLSQISFRSSRVVSATCRLGLLLYSAGSFLVLSARLLFASLLRMSMRSNCFTMWAAACLGALFSALRELVTDREYEYNEAEDDEVDEIELGACSQSFNLHHFNLHILILFTEAIAIHYSTGGQLGPSRPRRLRC